MKLINRRKFLKTTSLATLGSILATSCLSSVNGKKENMSLVILPKDSVANSVPSNWAVGELKAALENQGITVNIIDKLEDADGFCVLVSGMNSSTSKSIFSKQNIVAPVEAESLCIVQTKIDNHNVLLVSGTDALGLVYALTEIADRVNGLKTDQAALEFIEPVIERPASRTRSVLKGFSSEIEDKVWFYDKDYWMAYLDTLVYSRINRLNFSTGMAYNSVQRVTDGYMVFPYPFFVDIPNYQVTVRGLSNEERERNLEILKFIGTETAKRGLQFQFGLWTIAYNWDQDENPKKHSPNATYKTDGLTDENHANYCRDALAAILNEVPEISGLTFRVHEESGVSLGTGSFWKTQFSAVANCGRKVEIDMHAKNMEEETLYTALATKQPVVVSPKFCGEHLGLPYHQASIREFEMLEVDKLVDKGEGLLEGNRKFTRYGYADMLSENRTWDIIYRVWPGTQRFLLSGDPELFAGYGRTANFCGAAGFEICEPLHFKGRRGTGVAGGRCGYLDTSLKPRYDFEKYDYYFRLWGRMGYNPDTKPDVWRRALTNEFGSAALPIENALGQVTRVLPLFYLAHGVSANCAVYLPEIYTNSFIAKESDWPYDTQKPKTFGSISPMDPQLFQSPNECGEALVNGRNTGKYTPIEVAQWLEDMAEIASINIKKANNLLEAEASKPNFRRIEEDVLILIGMAQFFASKMRSAVLWKIYDLSGAQNAAEKSIELYENGRTIWANMAKRAETVYKKNISFGPDGTSGHWADRIPSFDEDIADMKNYISKPMVSISDVEISSVSHAISVATSKPKRPTVKVKHVPITNFDVGKPISINLETFYDYNSVILHYRHVNQSERWQLKELKSDGAGLRGEIPASFTNHRFPIQYYFEIKINDSEATLFPVLETELSNVPYYVVSRRT
jgi:hypothetical protein